MKILKQLVVIILSVAMVFTMMPFSVLAAGPEEQQEQQIQTDTEEPAETDADQDVAAGSGQSGSEESVSDDTGSDAAADPDDINQDESVPADADGDEPADEDVIYQDVSLQLKAKSDKKIPADKEHVITVKASNPNEDADVVVRLYLWNFDKDFYAKDKKDQVKEICDKVTVKDLEDDSTIRLPNDTKDAEDVKAELVTEKVAPDSEKMVRYLEFAVPANTKYKFDLPLVLEEDVIQEITETETSGEDESVHVIVEPVVVDQDEDSDAVDEPVDTEWEPTLSEDSNKEAEEKNDDDSTADYSSKKGVEGADVSGPAAANKEDAADTLADQTELTDAKAETVVKKIFAKGVNRDGSDSDDGSGSDNGSGDSGADPGYPSQGDGTNIDVMTAEWITRDSTNNEDSALLYVKSNGSRDQQVRLRINYALSGEHSYSPYDITISFPASIFKTRDGKNTGDIIIPYPEDPSKKQDFNWKQVGDKIVLTNTKKMSAATKGYVEIAFDGLDPALMKDMAVSEEFVATIEVSTYRGNTLALSTDPLTAQFDTEAKLTDVNKRNTRVTRVKASQIPENQRIAGEESYIKVDWYVWGATNANTYYTIDQLDYIPQTKAVQTKTVVEDGAVTNPNAQISVTDAQEYKAGAVAGDTVTTLTEADVKGFVLSAGSSDATELEKKSAYYGRSDGRGSDYSFSTVYPASQFKKDTNYTFHNTIKYTVTEADPKVTENTNPNVQEVDPQLVTDREASAQVTWSYTDPKWINPGGHYMVHKNGNDDNHPASSNTTHKSIYTYGDLHKQDDGYYGIYPSAINDLQKAYEKDGEDGSVRLSYTINTIGYTLPWMYDGGYAESRTGVFPTRIIGNYNRPITMTTTDTGVSFGRNGAKLQVGTDYTYEEIEFPGEPYVYKGYPQNLKPDGTWEALDAGDGTFKYITDTNKANWPDIKLQLQIGGEWQDWATVSWKTGRRVIRLESGETYIDTNAVKVPEGTQNFRTIVTTQNTAGGEGATEALQAGIQYDVRPVINLRSTRTLVDRFAAMFEQSNTPSMAVYNSTNLLIERADVNESDSERVIHSIDRDGYDSIRGYTTDTQVYPYKEATQNLREVDYENRLIIIHYKARVEERSYISDLKTWQEAVNEGNLQSEETCTWYDLLPKGVTPDTSTITLRTGDTRLSADTYENYKGSGRTLLVVKAKLKPVPQTYRSGDMTYYMDVPTISFDATYDFESWKDYGSNIHNVVAFESGNDSLGTVNKYRGEPDDPNSSNNISTKNAWDNKSDEKTWMTDLNRDGKSGEDADDTFLYAGVWTKVDLLAAARTSLYKDVEVNNDTIWNEGTYYTPKEEAVEATEGGNKRTVFEGGQYTYRLRVMSDPDTISAGMVLYDALEDFVPKGSSTGDPEDADNDIIDVAAVEAGATWQGTLREVDVSQLRKLGCEPVVYYSTVAHNNNGNAANAFTDDEGMDTPNDTVLDLTNTAVWTKASDYTGDKKDIKAIAVDCRYASATCDEDHYNEVMEDGQTVRYFKLRSLESAVVLVRMKAPSGEKARELMADDMIGVWGDSAQTYNNAYLYAASFKEDSGQEYSSEITRDFIRKDYTKVGLKEYSLSVDKAWNDDNDRDGKRPETITFELYANGKPFDPPKTQTFNVEKNKPVVFEHIPYTDDDGEKIHYTVVEHDVDGYTADVSVDSQDAQLYHVLNTHEPEKISLDGIKTWENDEDDTSTRPESIDVELYGNGKKIKTITVKPDSEGKWRYEFNNLFKYENGKEIVYTVKEFKTPRTGDKLDSYDPDYDEDLNIVNTYHPFGDLSVSKIVQDVTDVSIDQEFTFTFAFSESGKNEQGETVETPVFDDFAYEVLDADGNAVIDDKGDPVTGTVKTNGEVSIKGGQTIHVKEIPQGISYKATEASEDGFILIGKSGDSGTIKPNATAEAEFINKYSASGQINLEAEKILKNRKINKNQFVFELYEVVRDGEEELLEQKPSATNDAADNVEEEDGVIQSSSAPVTFGMIRFTHKDDGKTFTYRMNEVDRGKAGYIYTDVIYEAKVTVKDNGDGTLNITTVYTDEDGNEVEKPKFNNRYEAVGNTKLLAWKDLPGGDLQDYEFEFELLDENGDPIMNKTNVASEDTGEDSETGNAGDSEDNTGTPVTAKNKADGTVTFDSADVEALNYTQEDIGKTFHYAIREKAGDYDTVTYDTAVYGYEVKIVDNGDGTLYAEQTLATPLFEDESDPSRITGWTTEGAVLPVFKNKLEPGNLSIQKVVDLPTDGDTSTPFKFKVKLIGDDVPEGEMGYTISAATEVRDKNTDTSDNGAKSGKTAAKNAGTTDVELPKTGGDAPEAAKAGTSRQEKSDKSATLKAAASDDIFYTSGATNNWGVDVRITSDGEMIIGNGGTQTFNMGSGHSYQYCPWDGEAYGYSRTYFTQHVKSVRVDGTVNARGSFYMAFDLRDFARCEKVDLTGMNFSNVSDMYWMIAQGSSLKTVIFGDTSTAANATMYCMFVNDYYITEIDMSGFDTSNVTNMTNLFQYTTRLQKIHLGEKFQFKSGAVLNSPPNNATYTGKWVRDDYAYGPYTPAELASNYTAAMAGTWVWEEKNTEYTIKFTADAPVAGSMASAAYPATGAAALPANKFVKHGAQFDHWVVLDSEGNETSTTYEDKATIAGGTYSKGDVVTLKAVFKPADLKVNIEEGEFELELYAGEKATFENIPAGTAYQVYEETPSGWILVESVNASGIIEATETAEASFKNEYAPGTTSAQFFGTKTLDGKAAEGGKFSFQLKNENGEVIQEKSNMDGGFIQFDPIPYEEAGNHTYTITEVASGSDTIVYDTHPETVTVKVTEEGGELTAKVSYDSDGVRFANTTKPGNLKLTKKAENATEANENDEFTFRIRFNNANGQPLGKDNKIYWYTEPASATESAKANHEDSGTPKRSLRSKALSFLSTGKVTQEAEITQGTQTKAEVSDMTLKAAGAPALRAAGDDVTTTDFSYTGAVQTYVVPASGYYKFEAWGAQGGKATNSILGGKGGYSAGTIYLEEGQVIYVYVGGAGVTTPTPAADNNTVAGGWNGGGRAGNKQIGFNSRYYGSGGGGTDFRLIRGNWNNFTSLKSRIMVAGGGAGATNNSGSFPGGAGGGLKGIDGTGYAWDNWSPGYGAGQTYGGYGENYRTHEIIRRGVFGYASNDYWASAGGGGGYYGGGNSPHSQAGGGGSGFISGHPGCDAIAENSASVSNMTHTGQPNHYSGMVFTDTRMTAGNQSMPAPGGGNETGHSGNGYARITPLVTKITYDPNDDGSNQPKTITYNVGDELSLPHASAVGIDWLNHNFVGWAKNADEVFPDYQAGDRPDDLAGKTTTLYAVWTTEDQYLLHFDANGGYVSTQWKRVDDNDVEVTLPEPERNGWIFAGWNTAQDGSGTSLYDKVTGTQIGAEPGKTVTLYAQWVNENDYVKYQVKHYKQNATGEGYSLYETDYLIGRRGSQVTPAQKDYEGYVPRGDETTVMVPASGSMAPVEYYYDLCTYNVHFDGNGNTSGSMNDRENVKGGVSFELPANGFYKTGSIFTGWNTEADGSGKTYVNQQKVKNLTKENGGTVTLYAQWFDNENPILEPTNGEIIVSCRAGETIVIPELPAGTTYTIEEIGMADGWTQSGEITGNDDSIQANVTKYATATNVYNAIGEAQINAHKTLEGADIEEGQFTFELYNDAELTDLRDTATNGEVDHNANNTDGQGGSNPYYQTSLVEFMPIEYHEKDIGKTFTYYIREKGSANGESGIKFDETVYEVNVSVEDAGSGLLTTTVTYKDLSKPNAEATTQEPIFKNIMKPADLCISKTVENPSDNTPNDKFTFVVELTDADGNALTGRFGTKKTTAGGEEQAGHIDVEGTVELELKGGETITIIGLPHGTTYKVTEQPRANWTQTDASGNTGILQPDGSSTASFTNQYVQPDKYTASGSVILKAKKVVDGGTILEDDNFTFELTGTDGNTQTKTCDVVSTEDNPQTQSTVTFDEIHYTLNDLEYTEDDQELIDTYINDQIKSYQDGYAEAEDQYSSFNAYISARSDGKAHNEQELLAMLTKEAESGYYKENTFIYYVHEVAGEDPDVTYDKTRYYYKVHAVDKGDGTIETEVTKWKMGTKEDEVTHEMVADDTQLPEDEDNYITFTNSKLTQIKVYKRWDDNDNIDNFRPTVEEFTRKVHLMNGDTEVTGVTPVITEDADGNLTIVYTDLPAYDEDNNEITYTVKEDDIDQYTPRDSKIEAANGETLINVHTPGTTELKIHKSLDGYFDGGAQSNVTLAFKVEAKDAKGKVIFTGYAGLTFKKGETLTQEATVENVPLNAASITVTEEYSGAYGTAKPVTVTQKTGNIWEVTMTNKFDGGPPGNGVVNVYKDGKYVDPAQQPAEEPEN